MHNPQNNIYDSILTSNIYSNSNEVEVNLQVIDNQTGCLVNEFFYITVNTSTNYVDVNTDIQETDDNGFDEGFNSFWYCSPDSVTIDTLYNIFSDTTGIDSVLIDLGVAGSQMYYDSDGYEYFIITVSEPVSQITITSFTQGGCPPTIITYGILYNQEINAGNVNLEHVVQLTYVEEILYSILLILSNFKCHSMLQWILQLFVVMIV